MDRRERARRNSTAFVIVIVGHAVLVALLSVVMRNRSASPSHEHSRFSTLVYVLEPIDDRPRVAPLEPLRHLPIDRSISIDAPKPPPPIETSERPQVQRSSSPSIEWHRNGERAVDAAIARAQKKAHRDLGPSTESREPRAMPPPAFQWNPEDEKVGVAGLLPYVRLGKRCVIGLGFFACAIGELPKGNAHLFDNMRDPNQPESSVPDVPR